MFAELMFKESKIHAISLPQPVGVHIHLPSLRRKSQGAGKHWGIHHSTLLIVGRNERFMEAQVCSLTMHSLGQKVLALDPNARNFYALCIGKLQETQ